MSRPSPARVLKVIKFIGMVTMLLWCVMLIAAVAYAQSPAGEPVTTDKFLLEVVALVILPALGFGGAKAHAKYTRDAKAEKEYSRSEASVQLEIDNRIKVHDMRNQLGLIAGKAEKLSVDDTPETALLGREIVAKVETVRSLLDTLRLR